ncbi:MAG: nicotinate (nicotinamide) nucleotide adenylyltransferase [Flavobacteriales bacterium]
MRRVGLYLGSFNPIHLGHLVIANHMLNQAGLDEVWFVVTPSSPHKQGVSMIPEEHRLQMAHLALVDHPHLKASAVEFDLPRPNYTSDTLAHLRATHPDLEFSIIMGQDNLENFHTWKGYEELAAAHRLLIYPRLSTGSSEPSGEVARWLTHPNVVLHEAPVIAISSTYVRDAITAGHDVQYLLPDAVVAYIGNNHFYEEA